VRVRIYKVPEGTQSAGAGETAITAPQFEPMKPYPGMKDAQQHPGLPRGKLK
jgi:hypothetical protein